MDRTAFDPGLWERALRTGHFRHRDARGARTVEVGGLSLGSRFTPLLSRAHGRPVGHRGTLEVWLRDERLGPDRARAELLERGVLEAALALEPGLHMANYAAVGDDRGWLLLHVDDALPRHPKLWPPLPQDLFSSAGYAPHDIVLEVDVAAAATERLEDFARYHQELGFAVALSGFAEREADLGAVWRIAPDLVAVRAAATSEGRRPDAVRLLGALARVLHEAGSMVAVGGIEDDAVLRAVLATDADLIEGGAACADVAPPLAPLAADPRLPELRTRVAAAAHRIAEGAVFESACESLLGVPGVLRTFLLDAEGVQLTENLSPVGTRSDPRFWPLANAAGARWSHREYYRSARAHPGLVMATGPYFSLPDGRQCVTLSEDFEADGERLILCCDVAEYEAPASPGQSPA
jgi:EAL domain-containing protein (putative c-di-GMP-specific phosphodiesterase class I)